MTMAMAMAMAEKPTTMLLITVAYFTSLQVNPRHDCRRPTKRIRFFDWLVQQINYLFNKYYLIHLLTYSFTQNYSFCHSLSYLVIHYSHSLIHLHSSTVVATRQAVCERIP